MNGPRSPTTRRQWLAGVAALLGVSAAECGSFGSSDPAVTSTAESTPDGASTTAPPATSATTFRGTGTTTTVPDRNRTEHPVVQQRTDGGALAARTALLAAADWRETVSASDLAERVVAFLDGTDFEASYVAGFEVPVTEWGHYLRLEAVERRSGSLRITYSDVAVEGGPNVAQDRAMFVRLPQGDGVPEAVTLNRTDSDGASGDRTSAGVGQ